MERRKVRMNEGREGEDEAKIKFMLTDRTADK